MLPTNGSLSKNWRDPQHSRSCSQQQLVKDYFKKDPTSLIRHSDDANGPMPERRPSLAQESRIFKKFWAFRRPDNEGSDLRVNLCK